MLGLRGKSKNTWNWALCGKHPVARDYFRVSLTTPLLLAFESWTEKGYLILSNQKTPTRNVYSWRFWAKGLKKGNLICGVGKDSSDSIGRPFPLLIMGDGTLDGWEDDWDLLPYTFEKTWDQIEYISSRRIDNLKDLENQVCAIKNPNHDWLELKSQNRNQGKLQSSHSALTTLKDSGEIREQADRLAKKMEILLPLESQVEENPLTLACLWSSFLKVHNSGVPNAVFLGGVPEKHFLAVFNRSLNANDFVRLWSAHTGAL